MLGLAITLGLSRVHALPWEIWTSPYQLAALDARDVVLERSSYCFIGCRYDRSNAGSESASANPYPDRWLYSNGGEAVIFEDSGPGAITRIWMTTGFGLSNTLPNTMRARFYLNGSGTPSLDLPLVALFDGSTLPFTPPLALDRLRASGGNVSMVPFAYSSGIRVTLTNADTALLWFQFQYHRLPLGAVVTSFVPGVDATDWRDFLTHQGDDPWHAMLPVQWSSASLLPGNTLSLATHSAPAWLRGLRLRLPRSAYALVRLQLTFDNELRVDLPLSDFFATPVAATVSARAVLLGEDADGWLYAWFPMPFRQQANITLVTDPGLPTAVSLDSEISWDDAAVPTNAALFQAVVSDACPTLAGQDHVLFSNYGAGRVIGVAANYQAFSTPTREYLEGDERAYRDGSSHPAWYGTGIEDFYNGGFYFDQGAYAQALSGATRVDADGTGVTSVYRLLLSDFLSYQARLTLTQENGATGQLPMCARSTVYAYTQTAAQLVPYARLDVGDPAAVIRYSYQPPLTADCHALNSIYGDEPPSARYATACYFGAGNSHFHMAVQAAASPLRLRRIYDAAQAGQKAEIWINSTLAGVFPYNASNPIRRWQEQDVVLNTAVSGTDFDIEIRPQYGSPDGAIEFSDSAYELWGAPTDPIFRNGLE